MTSFHAAKHSKHPEKKSLLVCRCFIFPIYCFSKKPSFPEHIHREYYRLIASVHLYDAVTMWWHHRYEIIITLTAEIMTDIGKNKKTALLHLDADVREWNVLQWNIPSKPTENKGAETDADLISGVMFFSSCLFRRSTGQDVSAICGRCSAAVGWLRWAMSDSEKEWDDGGESLLARRLQWLINAVKMQRKACFHQTYLHQQELVMEGQSKTRVEG